MLARLPSGKLVFRFGPGRPVRDNAELVERAASLATTALRPPMTTDEARALLNVKDRRNGDGA